MPNVTYELIEVADETREFETIIMLQYNTETEYDDNELDLSKFE